MLSFENDYSEGCHPRILEALTRTNLEQLPGYGADHYCAEAAEKIRVACQAPQAQVFFITGGTQTNQLAVDLLLHPTEGVVAAETGHVNTHEAGAIEYTGHKVMPLPAHNGKLQAQDLADLLRTFWDDASCEHMVAPGMVYLSHPTEYGTLYTRQELTDIAAVCRQYRIPLYLDGARLAYGLEASETDLTLPEIARLCDVLYIGGTKVGALCGEALVFCQQPPARITARIKQHGALNAKAGCWAPVRCAVYRRAVFPAGPPRRRTGHGDEAALSGQGVPAVAGQPHQSAVPSSGGRRGGAFGQACAI